jgi:hypothetical protein
MAVAAPGTEAPFSLRERWERWNRKRALKRALKVTREPRRIVRAVLRTGDVILDSASGIPGVGVFKEMKDGTSAVLDDVQDFEQER